ncbi:MAG TPA: PPOX class F420-dependent oxidoreductase [Candidatus Limnocylindrales bacterium]|nr:PPOX class F420-dependent oxidoreductase [Candidatus Limnocylindrales bacterium]
MADPRDKSAALTRLAEEPYSSLATFKRDGTPVAVPIWHAVADGRIYMFTEAASVKVKRLRRDPRVTLAPCNWRGEVREPRWSGKGRVVDDPAVVARAYEALDRKYGWQKWIVDGLSKLAGRYHARAILEIDLDGEEA